MSERGVEKDAPKRCSRCGHASAIEHLPGECFECNAMTPGGTCAHSDLRVTPPGESA